MHITQRGINRAAMFVDANDCERYRDLLAEITVAHALPVHAYVLMGNHVHLLVTANEANSLARAMRLLNQRYVAAFNRRHRRTGPLCEGRFRSCLVDSERYLLSVYRYIELNPVRAAMVDSAEKYPWSSAIANLGLARDACVVPHAVYLSLGPDPMARAQAYGDLVSSGVSERDLRMIRAHMQQERVLGERRFVEMIEKTLNRPVALRQRGRPRNVARVPEGVSNG
jgi:putative transposase